MKRNLSFGMVLAGFALLGWALGAETSASARRPPPRLLISEKADCRNSRRIPPGRRSRPSGRWDSGPPSQSMQQDHVWILSRPHTLANPRSTAPDRNPCPRRP